MDRFIGSYERFETASKKEAAVLLGADNTIGDKDVIEIEYEDGCHKAWLVSRFGQRLGYFPPAFSRQLAVRASEGLTLVGLLTLVGYTDTPEPGHYWGEAAVIAYDARIEALTTFVDHLSDQIATGLRPRIDLGPEAVDQIIAANGGFDIKEAVPLPQKSEGTVFMKKHRTLSERMIEKGRQRNVGCYIASWAFLLALVTLIVWGVLSCTVL